MRPKRAKSYPFLVLLFTIVAVISWSLYCKNYWAKDTVHISEFPKVIENWSSEELPISKDDRDMLETNNVFLRSYTNSKNQTRVYLFIVYSQNNRKVSHPPEVCYTGAGVTIVDRAKDAIYLDSTRQAGVEANSLTLEKGEERHLVYYWFKVGDSFTTSYWKQQFLIAVKSFLGQPASSALIRVSAPVTGDDNLKAANQIKEFGRLIIPKLERYLP